MEKNDIEKQFEMLKKAEIADPEWLRKNRRSLIFYTHNVTNSEISRLQQKNSLTDDVTAFHYRQSAMMRAIRSYKIMPIILVLVLLATGGMSAAANSSVPGDTLYPWKVGVNENIQSVLVVGAENQAKFELGLVKKRLVDMEKLVARENAKAEAKAEASTKFEAQARVAEEKLDKLEVSADAKAEAFAKFEAALSAHQEILNRLNARVEDKPKLQNAIDTINRVILKLEAKSDEIEMKIEEKTEEKSERSEVNAGEKAEADAQARADAQIQAAERRISASAELIAKAEERGSIVVRAEQTLEMAKKALIEAKALYDASNYVAASVQATMAIKLSAQAQGMFEVHKSIDANVKSMLNLTSRPPEKTPAPTPSPATEVESETSGESTIEINIGN